MSRIEINYISPITNITFSPLNKYYLVISYIVQDNIVIYKLQITLNNITDITRAYHIHHSIDMLREKTIVTVQLFQHDSKNKLILLFTNIVDPTSFEYNNIQAITLFPPPPTHTIQKHAQYVNSLSFLSEQFYNYESLLPANQCIIFFTLRPNSRYPQMPFTMYPINNLPKSSSYNKYHQLYTIPVDPIRTLDYIKFLTHYQIDINKYVPKISSNFKDMVLRKIDLSKRLPIFDPNLNNVIVCPTDCSSVKMVTSKSFSCTLSPSDYPRIHLPYQGYLLNIKTKYLNNNKFCYILNFTNNYFIPNSVGEREYISVVYGHNVQVSRGYPELVDVQPNTTLYFDIILIGSVDDESILITNLQLQQFMNNPTSKKPWFDQGAELCGFNNCLGQMIMSFNREIEFDIDDNNNFIKLNDTIGYIQ